MDKNFPVPSEDQYETDQQSGDRLSAVSGLIAFGLLLLFIFAMTALIRLT